MKQVGSGRKENRVYRLDSDGDPYLLANSENMNGTRNLGETNGNHCFQEKKGKIWSKPNLQRHTRSPNHGCTRDKDWQAKFIASEHEDGHFII